MSHAFLCRSALICAVSRRHGPRARDTLVDVFAFVAAPWGLHGTGQRRRDDGSREQNEGQERVHIEGTVKWFE